MRVVLDTNVAVSAILFGGKPQEILKAALAGDLRLCISEAMVTELQRVLQRPKFGFKAQIIQSIISELTLLADWVTPKKHLDLVKDDPADNLVIDCAVEASADYIITGDKHLLQLGKCGKVEIANPDAFIKILARSHR
jgi:putative PIN family toxin of toxin-antitoxin system